MRRDTQEGKPRFDLCLPEGVPYKEQMLTRFAMLMLRGVDKYGERNWELADSKEELDRFRGSALRHCLQWFLGEIDEDHSAAVMFNLLAAETLKNKRKELNGDSQDPSKESSTGSKEDYECGKEDYECGKEDCNLYVPCCREGTNRGKRA